ncbi:MAG: phosphatidylglycerophosphatase A [Mariprofundaceae bacterium]
MTILHDGLRFLAAGLGCGWLPVAPGTWGSIASLFPAWIIAHYVGYEALLIGSMAVLLLGCAICARLLPELTEQDPAWIVIDEWAGQWLCLAICIPFLGAGIVSLVAAFAAFRLFDVWKPWPISALEHKGPAWWSIMADDVMAGLMGGAAVAGIITVAQQGGA